MLVLRPARRHCELLRSDLACLLSLLLDALVLSDAFLPSLLDGARDLGTGGWTLVNGLISGLATQLHHNIHDVTGGSLDDRTALDEEAIRLAHNAQLELCISLCLLQQFGSFSFTLDKFALVDAQPAVALTLVAYRQDGAHLLVVTSRGSVDEDASLTSIWHFGDKGFKSFSTQVGDQLCCTDGIEILRHDRLLSFERTIDVAGFAI